MLFPADNRKACLKETFLGTATAKILSTADKPPVGLQAAAAPHTAKYPSADRRVVYQRFSNTAKVFPIVSETAF